MERDQKDYLNDVKQEIKNLESFVKDLDFESFTKDIKTIRAVERLLEIVYEASKHVAEGYKNYCPEIPWVDVRGMRNIISHEYMRVDHHVIWKTINEDIPILKNCINKIIDYLDIKNDNIN